MPFGVSGDPAGVKSDPLAHHLAGRTVSGRCGGLELSVPAAWQATMAGRARAVQQPEQHPERPGVNWLGAKRPLLEPSRSSLAVTLPLDIWRVDPASGVTEELIPSMSYLSGTPSALPDQPVRTVDPEVERLAHMVVDGLIARLAAEPAVPAVSLLDNLADQLQQAAALRRLGVVRRTSASASAAPSAATPRQAGSQRASMQQSQ